MISLNCSGLPGYVKKRDLVKLASKLLVLKLKPRKTPYVLSLAVITDAEMRKINKKTRGKDKPTDVLSFAFNEPRLLGEVLIAKGMLKLRAKQEGITLKEEFDFLFTHGVLHILGYTHREMEDIIK